MTGLTDLVGVLINCGMIASGDTRIVNAKGASGLGMLSGLLPQHPDESNTNYTRTRTNIKPSLNMFGSLNKLITNALGIKQSSFSGCKLASARLGILTNILFDGNSDISAKERSHGGEAMALLVILAFQAFKNIHRQPAGMRAAVGSSEILLGMRTVVNAEEEKQLEQTATLILRGMISAAKVDSQIGNEGIQNIIAHIRESDSSEEIQLLIFEEMQLPLNLDSLVNEIPNEAVAALIYAASLFAIEVNTTAEREYLEQFVQRTGLDAEVAQHLQAAVGVS